METDFAAWLTSEMDKRGWTNSELARQAGIAQSNISMVISGQKNPGLSFCVNVAAAFGYPPERVLREAGLLPPAPSAENPEYRELVEVAKNLSTEELRNALEYLQWRYRLQAERRKSEKPENAEDQ